jgi:hypothetical protein
MTDPDVLAKRLLQRAHNRDGLPELVAGLIFLLTSGLIYALEVLPKGTLRFRAAVLSFAFLLPVFTIGARPFVNWIRNRYLTERWGYVGYQPVPRTLRAFLAPGLVALTAIAIMALVLPSPGNWFIAATGIACGALLAAAGRLPRFVVGGIVTAAAGICLAYSGVSFPAGMAALFAIQGAGGTVSGAVTFCRFVAE